MRERKRRQAIKLIGNGEADLRSTRAKIHVDRANMRCEISVQDLLDHIAEYLDLDERFWGSHEGRFEWCGRQVNFHKGDDVIVVVVGDELYEVVRV